MEKQRKSPQRPQEPQQPSVPPSAPLINTEEGALQGLGVWAIRIILLCGTVAAHLMDFNDAASSLGLLLTLYIFFL
tara:strand:+ start:9972 stop:10199 length:228 start_codon:yes stop_codon:yes gene_type:complete